MATNTFLFFYFLLFIKTISARIDTFSHLEKYNNNSEIRYQVEQIYIESYKNKNKTTDEDPVCNLTNSKKQALCDLIYKIKYYQENKKIYLNKIALYNAKLICKNTELSFQYKDYSYDEAMQKIYLCPGRHKNTETSFIEDSYYNKFYVSTGPFNNSVAIYVRVSNAIEQSYFIYDYIYNVDLLKLENFRITTNDVVQELKLNKQIFSQYTFLEIENIYLNTQYYKEKNDIEDSICDLDYEKKISLCHIIFHQFYSKRNIVPVTLNKAASYIFSMTCLTETIYGSSNENRNNILRAKQKLYPCYSRAVLQKTDNLNENLLEDVYLQKFYLSSGPSRNRIFVYMFLLQKFHLFDLFGNINLKNLKPTVLTVNDIMIESMFTYAKVEEIINNVEEKHKRDLSSISYKSETEINEKIENMLNISRNLLQNIRTSKKTKSTHSSKNLEQSSIESFVYRQTLLNPESETEESLTKNRNVIQIGPQVFQRLLQKIKTELAFSSSSSITQKYKKKLIQRELQSANKKFSINQKLKEEVEQLISKMELFLQIQKQTAQNKQFNSKIILEMHESDKPNSSKEEESVGELREKVETKKKKKHKKKKQSTAE